MIKKFESFNGKKIAIYHGLGGTPADDRINYLNSVGYDDIYYPYIDFEEEWYFDKGKTLVEFELEQIADCDVIIGFSLGGYLAYLLAGKTHKDLIMVNPSLDRSKTKLDIKNFNVNVVNNFKNIELFLGSDDTLIDKNVTIDFLKQNNIKTTNHILQGMEHRTPLNYFIEIIKKSRFL